MRLTFFIVTLSLLSLAKSGVVFNNGTATLTMKKGISPEAEMYACDIIPTKDVLGGKEVGYITGIEPKPDKTFAHHILVWACHNVRYDRMETKMCPGSEGQRVLFAWGHGNKGSASKPFEFPPGVSIKVNSSETEFIKYQMHYSKTDPSKSEDQSSLKFTIQEEPTELESFIFMFWKVPFVIPPGRKKYSVDTNCKMNANVVPFAAMFHTHALGRLIIFYHWDHETDILTEVMRRDPQLSQEFIPLDSGLSFKKGDIIHVRCIFNSKNRTGDTEFDLTYKGEMCLLYVMAHSPIGMAEAQACLKEEYRFLSRRLPQD